MHLSCILPLAVGVLSKAWVVKFKCYFQDFSLSNPSALAISTFLENLKIDNLHYMYTLCRHPSRLRATPQWRPNHHTNSHQYKYKSFRGREWWKKQGPHGTGVGENAFHHDEHKPPLHIHSFLAHIGHFVGNFHLLLGLGLRQKSGCWIKGWNVQADEITQPTPAN